TGDALLSGCTTSCGCARLDALARVRETYGDAQMRLHLIDGTCVERLKRSGLQKNNTSGHTGVQRRGDKWAAVITFQKRNYYLGRFDRFEDAVKAREAAEEQLHRNFLEEYLK
ncbi:MAG: transcriptional regulator, partial [Lachnospiraceae bacterium]|nr:transcriptional regulator [Lachnospiraceae bacterium]